MRISCLLLAFALAAGPAWSQTRVYTVDPAQSQLSISGKVVGANVTEQGSGSLTTRFGGNVQVVLGPNTIHFPGGSLLIGQDSGSWEPKADGSKGSEPANYGAKATSFLASGLAALRNIQFDVVSSNLNLSGSEFESRSLVFFFPSNAPSAFSYTMTGLFAGSGVAPLQGYATNSIATVSTITDQTLTIPIDATFMLSLLSTNDSSFTVKGKLVATASSAAPLTLATPQVQGQEVTLQWQSEPGQVFQVQSSGDLRSWQTNATGVTSATSSYTWTGAATGEVGFYRVAR